MTCQEEKPFPVGLMPNTSFVSASAAPAAQLWAIDE